MSLGQGSHTGTTRPRRPSALRGTAGAPSAGTRPNRPRIITVDLILRTAVLLGSLLLFLLKAPGAGYFLTSSDHGYQLSIGTQVLLGKVPGVDIIIAYGPLVMYTSAFGLWLSDSLIGETILCSMGYAVTLFLIYHLVSRYASKRVGLVAAGFGFLLQARFYKWYVWLIPVAILWVWHRAIIATPERRWRWVLAGGMTLGICWLYRPDFGTSLFLASLVFVGVIELSELPRNNGRALQRAGLLLAGFAIFPLAWLAYLACRVGPQAPFTFLETTVHATMAVSTGMSHPPLPIRSVLLAYGVIPATYLLALAAAARHTWTGGRNPRLRFLLASALVGVGCVHQSLHRMDPAHLLQVVSAAILCGSVAACWLVEGAEGIGLGKRAQRWARLAGCVYAILLVAIGIKLSKWGQFDLEPLSLRPAEKYSALANPLGHPGRDRLAATLSEIASRTGSSEAILVFPLDAQFYALTRRPMSGRLHAYYPGVFDKPKWHEANLAAIRANMPKLVVVPADFSTDPSLIANTIVGDGRGAHRYLENFIRDNYPRVVLSDGGLTVLSR